MLLCIKVRICFLIIRRLRDWDLWCKSLVHHYILSLLEQYIFVCLLILVFIILLIEVFIIMNVFSIIKVFFFFEMLIGLRLGSLNQFLFVILRQSMVLPCQSINFSLVALNISFEVFLQFKEAFGCDSAIAPSLVFFFLISRH